MKQLLIISLFLFGSLNLQAADVDLSKSSFKWTGSKKIGGSYHTGPIKMKSAKVDEEEGTGQFVADMKSIDESEMKGEMKAKFLGHIKSADFFNVEKFPTATLKIEKLDWGYMYGKLTVLGKTNDVVVPFKKDGKTITGEMAFDRTKYGIKYGSGSFFKSLGDKIIRDTIKLEFKVVLK
ncbi:MAG: YceI family protein [Bdellovibrionota bacterium]|nr:lipid-binding protein [Pseudobdellovibrionaceae bacterium]|tara:strand:+ start:27006 stop:27542 length:537 start_codon:yes stop_codon:yes gene_type:complete